MSGNRSTSLLDMLFGTADQDFVYRLAIKKIAHILSEKIDDHGIYEIGEDRIHDLATEIADELYFSDSGDGYDYEDESDGYDC